MEPERLSEIIQEAGFDPRPYSGRGMGSAECVAFNIDKGEGFHAVARVVAVVDNPAERQDLVDVFENVRIDSLGIGQVMYFPWVLFESEDG